jgi:hypothetical protein
MGLKHVGTAALACPEREVEDERSSTISALHFKRIRKKKNGTTFVAPLEIQCNYFRAATAAPTPASLASAAALSVASQVKSGSFRPKCP